MNLDYQECQTMYPNTNSIITKTLINLIKLRIIRHINNHNRTTISNNSISKQFSKPTSTQTILVKLTSHNRLMKDTNHHIKELLN